MHPFDVAFRDRVAALGGYDPSMSGELRMEFAS